MIDIGRLINDLSTLITATRLFNAMQYNVAVNIMSYISSTTTMGKYINEKLLQGIYYCHIHVQI